MASSHDLLRLAFAAIRGAPERPLIVGTDRIERIPELCRDSGIRRILHHADTLAMLDLPTDLAAELKIVAPVVNRPGAVGLHENAVIGGSDQLLEGERLLAGQQADVGHANHGQAVPAFGAQRSAGTIFADGMRGLART